LNLLLMPLRNGSWQCHSSFELKENPKDYSPGLLVGTDATDAAY